MVIQRICFLCLLLIFSPGGFRATAAIDPDAANVVVVVNTNEPGSRQIADYYVAKRGIPTANIIELSTSTEETISLAEYVETIHNPLLNALLAKEWITGVKQSGKDRFGREQMSVAVHHISYLVMTRGLPLRIQDDPEQMGDAPANLPAQFKHNRAAVDSELCLLAGPPGLPVTGFIPNPLFEKRLPTGPDAARVLRVCRLDGPTVAQVLSLIDRTLEAEEKGLVGRAYFDLGGPHAKGDEWLSAAGDLAKAAYFDCDFETSKRPMGIQDRYDAPAIYMGWYRAHAFGLWRARRWGVPPGAIAFHLHSFSATTVRSESKAWLGPFVAQGYCATFGNVYEPYLELTHRPQMVLEMLLEGRPFGEAVLYSIPVLSWEGVAIGDPLYRPFKVGLEAQLEEDEGPYASYAVLREINRLKAKEGEAAALQYARSQFIRFPSLALAYRLAALYDAAGSPEKGVEALKVVRYISTFSPDEYVLVQKIANFLNRHGESELAFQLYENLLSQKGLGKPLKISLLEGGAKVAQNAGQLSSVSRWSLEASQLKQPPAKK
ncbi:TIGR03790 family protein [Coraliomargarita parva]|uniref:TIGR03790 family protein n=1 Tax=Coraliomargarita parva TaxID=3014050 RepID=UPI0022B37DB6|nr:TIGR03790 family protein [Coraliomargarita parva]